MANSHVELDFLGLHNYPNLVPQPQPQPQPHTQSQPKPRLDRRQSFRGISRINPEIVKSVLASAGKHAAPENYALSQLPVFQPHPIISGQGSMEKAEETAPLTIFYNGTVSVFDLSNDKADYIMKFAMENHVPKNDGQVMDNTYCNSRTTNNDNNILGPLNEDMPIKRKKSLQRFFEKRKERLISVSPYSSMEHVAPGAYKQKT